MIGWRIACWINGPARRAGLADCSEEVPAKPLKNRCDISERNRMRKILFVDDEPHVLAAMKRLLHLYRNRWEMHFVSDSQHAAQLVQTQTFDLVLSDYQMPGINGAELLEQVRQRSPETARVILSGVADNLSLSRLTAVAHRVVAKPCQPEAFKEIVLRICVLQESMPNLHLRRQLLARNSFPSRPLIFAELQSAIDSRQTSSKAVATIVSRDLNLATKIVQLANSSYYGCARKITQLDHAIAMLGIDTISALALSLGTMDRFAGKVNSQWLDRLMDHSLEVARLAADMATQLPGTTTFVNEAFLAGLLHDCGKLVLAQAGHADDLPPSDSPAWGWEIPDWQAEQKIWGMNHAAVGGMILELWGLPLSLAEAVSFHHQPAQATCMESNAAAVVHIADAMFHLSQHRDPHRFDAQVDPALLQQLEWQTQVEHWKNDVLDPNKKVHVK